MSPPERIGRYEIRSEIGRGTMGVVYLALDPLLERLIALKTIELAFVVTPSQRETFEQRFFAEARIAARLTHPNIVVVHDVGRDEGSGALFIALEYLEGRTLGERLAQRQPLEWREALTLVGKVADALQHAHEQRVVHRDVKPANIMILPGGEPKIMDFGIAKIETARLRLTQGGEFFGTPLYLSPEQALGQPVDARGDIFSLGAIAYEMLTGRLAFGAENMPRILGRVIGDEPPPPSHVVPDLPQGVDSLVAQALAKSPDDRYPSARALAQDVEDLLSGRPPRHWGAPFRASATAFAARPAIRAPSPEPRAPDLAELALAVPGVPGAARGDAPRGWRARRWLLACLIAVLAGVGYVGLARWWPRSGPDALAVPAPVSTMPDAGRPSAEAVEATPTPPPREEPSAAPETEPARLAIDFRHSLRQGRLRVFVDGELVLDEELKGRVEKKIVFIKRRKGSLEDVLDLEPGRHVIRLQVAWDDNVKAARIRGTFRAGVTRQLEANLGGLLKKDLSLAWR